MNRACVLLPEWKRCVASAQVANGTLSRWLARGNRLESSPAGIEQAIRDLFEFGGRAFPAAALSRQVDVGDAAGSLWLRADPAHLRADMTTARMLACGELGLSASETGELAKALKPLFGDAGFEFDARLPNRWYLRAAMAAELPQCATPDEAMGDDLKLHLPAGASGRRWRQLYNDAQIILHNHAVNERRAARGAVTVNSLWFWGAGALPAWVRSPLTKVVSPSLEIRALAALAGIPVHEAEGDAIGTVPQRNSEAVCLIDLANLRGDALEQGGLQPLDRALRRGGLGVVELFFASGERYLCRAAHRYRFWRRPRGLQP
ncbi:MAG TPA: phosphoglycerate mutase [Dokdonella sp.]|uniref:phosphoglycerate mutase n=1 Tax=Dokdonella sp. TaxID=2291710 RepID=UPI002BD7F79C|nr:phosphoglycerate mutase [Xanthomonadales bacterium]HQV72031.1 phosphoglycerate mutase [Dokdonella sp.]HQW76279.1 phosphoglycerate mutase [Dokdonella sp.]HQZ62448.1 phosphoglycerate mutase [Dokdonella sp.]